MHVSRRIPQSIATIAVANGARRLASACGGGGKGDFTNSSLVTLGTASVPAGATGQPYAAQLTATFPHPPGQFVVSAGRLPPGVELDNLTGAITGFPRQLGRFNFDISARDGLDPTLPPGRDSTFSEAVKSYALDVNLGTPNILPQAMPAAQYRHSFLYQIDVAGGTPPYVFTLESGTLPAGISLSQTGVLGNFPTQANVAPGVPFEFDVKVTDANNLTDTAHFALNVVVLPLIILTSSINEAAKDFPYDVQLQLASSGGGQPITWSQATPGVGEISLASIGMEITADGHVRNTFASPGPSTVGTHKFTAKVTDEALQVATRQYTLKVNPGPVLTAISPARASLGGPFTVTGSNFQPGAVLVFKPGASEVTITPTYLSATQLRFNNAPTAPGGGAVPVKVLNPDTGAFTKPAAFVFTATTVAFGTKGFLSSNVSSMGIDCADVTGDGFADVIHCGATGVQGWSGGPVSASAGLLFHRNLGTTSPVTFSSQTLDAGNFYDCKFADVNSDGRLDIVALGQTQLKVWINNPLGTFTAGPVSTLASGNSYPNQMTIGKFNADAIVDVAYGISYPGGSGSTGKAYTMIGNGSGSFTLVGQATSQLNSFGGSYGVPAIASGDSDGDGRDEVMTAVGWNYGYYQGNAAYYSQTDTSGNFGAWGTRATLTNPAYYFTTMGASSGDYLGLGSPQILTLTQGTYSGYPGSVLFLHSGANYSSNVSIAGTSEIAKRVDNIDADFDSKMDWAVSSKPGLVYVYRASSQAKVASMDLSAGSPSVSSPTSGRMASGDIDNDGRPDLLVTTSSWICEGMGYMYSSSYNQAMSGDGGSKGFVWYLNASN